MAGAAAAGAIAAAATTSSAVPPPPPVTGKSLISSSYLPSSFPSRERRTNHLRKKILKTLENKPYPDPTQPEFPRKTHTISIEETVQQQPVESELLSLSEGNRFVDAVLGTFSNKSFAKIGLYLVGAFVFQTICAVLIFGLNDLDDEDDSLSSNDHRNEKKSKEKLKLRSDLLLSGTKNSVEMKEGVIGLVDESKMDNRIMEIQEMARRAREQEKMEANRKGLVEDENDDIDYDLVGKAVKKKEVDDRLSKLRRSLEGDYQKLGPKVSRNEGDVGKNVDNDSLMFKKKYKYKSPSVDTGDKPKGFNGMKDVRVADGSVINGITVDDGTLQTDKKIDRGTLSSDDRSGSEVSVSKDETKEQEPRATKTEPIAGTSKEPKYDKQTINAEKLGKSNNLGTRKPRGFGKESNDTTTTKHDDFNKNGGLKGRRGGNKKSARNIGDKSSTQMDFWWTRLPYVMAIQMQSGGNGEESSGLFTLRSISGLSHTVAFEDRSDATNFCYLLESFFEELHGFSTNIIPIPTNELVKEVKSQILKVVVVKKGQLKLYIGQPLEDVESALRKLIEQQDDNEL